MFTLMKSCPYCAEKISDNALKCKFCWESLSDGNSDVGDDLNVTIKKFWHKKQTFKSVIRYIISIIFMLGGLATYSDAYDGTTQISWILLLILWAVWLYLATLLS